MPQHREWVSGSGWTDVGELSVHTLIPPSEAEAARIRAVKRRAQVRAGLALGFARQEKAYTGKVVVEQVGDECLLRDHDGSASTPIATHIFSRHLAEAIAAFLNS
jgi:hypothetical protein